MIIQFDSSSHHIIKISSLRKTSLFFLYYLQLKNITIWLKTTYDEELVMIDKNAVYLLLCVCVVWRRNLRCLSLNSVYFRGRSESQRPFQSLAESLGEGQARGINISSTKILELLVKHRILEPYIVGKNSLTTLTY